MTKLDSVERLVEKYCPEHNAINDEPGREEGFYHCSHCAEIINARFTAALTEMWDLSRREALREAAELGGGWTGDSADPHSAEHYRGFWDGRAQYKHQLLEMAERLAVEEGTK